MITWHSVGGVVLIVIILLFVILFGSLFSERKEKKKLISSQTWFKSQFAYFNEKAIPPEGYPLVLAVKNVWPQLMCADLKFAMKKIANIQYNSSTNHLKSKSRWRILSRIDSGDDLQVMWTKISLLCEEFNLNRYNVRLVRFKETYGIMVRTTDGDYFLCRDTNRVMTLQEADLLLTLKMVEAPGKEYWLKFNGFSVQSFTELREMIETN